MLCSCQAGIGAGLQNHTISFSYVHVVRIKGHLHLIDFILGRRAAELCLVQQIEAISTYQRTQELSMCPTSMPGHTDRLRLVTVARGPRGRSRRLLNTWLLPVGPSPVPFSPQRGKHAWPVPVRRSTPTGWPGGAPPGSPSMPFIPLGAIFPSNFGEVGQGLTVRFLGDPEGQVSAAEWCRKAAPSSPQEIAVHSKFLQSRHV